MWFMKIYTIAFGHSDAVITVNNYSQRTMHCTVDVSWLLRAPIRCKIKHRYLWLNYQFSIWVIIGWPMTISSLNSENKFIFISLEHPNFKHIIFFKSHSMGILELKFINKLKKFYCGFLLENHIINKLILIGGRHFSNS